jgi:hypothetical protein
MCTVWFFARALSATDVLPALQSLSDGKFPFCHWGVLITTMDISEVMQAIETLRSNDINGLDNMDFGTMYELFRGEGNINSVNISRPVSVKYLRSSWATFSARFAGRTTLSQENIERAGTVPLSET